MIFAVHFISTMLMQFGSKVFTPKGGVKIFPPLKLHFYSWPRCESFTFVVIKVIIRNLKVFFMEKSTKSISGIYLCL